MAGTRRLTPVELATAYQEYERGTRTLLDDLERATIEGNHQEVRERIRAFADTRQKVFFAVSLALNDSEGFFQEVESKLGRETAAEFEELRETYGSLAEPFNLVRLEVARERQNPITNIDVRTAYSTEQEVPLVSYTVSSGGVELHEYQGTPQEALQSAGYIVQATNESLESALEADRSVNTDELSGLIDRYEKLESELNTLFDHIDTLRRKPIEE